MRKTEPLKLLGDFMNFLYQKGLTDQEPFEGYIKESFLKKNLKASRILKDIQSKGYKGSQYALYAYIRNELKPLSTELSRNNPNAFKSYETAPGEQMQESNRYGQKPARF